jgi:hypothetical protein
MAALDFPADPTNGQEYQGYFWDGTDEVWKLSPTPPILDIDDISNVDTTGVTDGQALVYDAANSEWVAGDVASGPEPAKTITSDNIALDFSDGIELEQRTVTGDVTFTASNYTSGAKKTVYLEGDTVQRSLTFPASWNFITDKPTDIGANKKNILDLNSFGTSESTTVALWLGASSFEPLTAIGGTTYEIQLDGVTWKIHEYNSSGTFEVSDIGILGEIDVLVVGGGASGGLDNAGGGGAGGLIFNNGFSSFAVSTVYSILVGAGGAGRNNGAGGERGLSGSNSEAFGLVALGGGAGAGQSLSALSGGSGGGGTWDALTPGNGLQPSSSSGGYGNAGGAGNLSSSQGPGGGGGGATQVGGTAGTSMSHAGNGGDGLDLSSYFGTTFGDSGYFAGGGAGGVDNSGGLPAAGWGVGGLGGGGSHGSVVAYQGDDAIPNTGGGGAGGSYNGSTVLPSGAGGDGVVLIRYPITDPN